MEKTATMFVAFGDEASQILKEAGLKELLLKEIPGTKPWVIGNTQMINHMGKPMASAAKTVARPKPRTGQMPGGAWDVSRQAAEMGL